MIKIRLIALDVDGTLVKKGGFAPTRAVRDALKQAQKQGMLVALASGTVDFICTDVPTAQGALIAYPNFTILDFSGSSHDFEVSEEEVNIGVSVQKGNTELKNKIDSVLSTMTVDDMNALMQQAIAVQPLSE